MAPGPSAAPVVPPGGARYWSGPTGAVAAVRAKGSPEQACKDGKRRDRTMPPLSFGSTAAPTNTTNCDKLAVRQRRPERRNLPGVTTHRHGLGVPDERRANMPVVGTDARHRKLLVSNTASTEGRSWRFCRVVNIVVHGAQPNSGMMGPMQVVFEAAMPKLDRAANRKSRRSHPPDRCGRVALVAPSSSRERGGHARPLMWPSRPARRSLLVRSSPRHGRGDRPCSAPAFARPATGACAPAAERGSARTSFS
jgi:hypothetical protein